MVSVGRMVFLAGQALLSEQNRVYSLKCGVNTSAVQKPSLQRLDQMPTLLGLQCWPGDTKNRNRTPTTSSDRAPFPRLPVQGLPADPQTYPHAGTARVPRMPRWQSTCSYPSCSYPSASSLSQRIVGTSLGHLGQGLPIQAFPGPTLYPLSGWSMPWSEGGGRSFPSSP